MSMYSIIIACLSLGVIVSESAKILTIVPTASISHQVVFRPLTQELVKRGHEVTIITTDPVFPKGQAPENLTEIDLHDLSYSIWREAVIKHGVTSGNSDDIVTQMKTMLPAMSAVIKNQFYSAEVQALLRNKPKLDLLIIEACNRVALVYSYIFPNIPVIQVSSFGGLFSNWDAMGAPSRPVLLYPTPLHQRVFDLSLWDKIKELYKHYSFESMVAEHDSKDNGMLKKLTGENTPTINELENNVDLLMLNVHPMWDQNRPVPPGVVYIGGIHQKPSNELPKELKTYLDSSRHGVIYISFGTNVSPSLLPPEKIQVLVKVFSQLPYDVLWKWDQDELPGRSANIRISKWLPQSDLLKHPNIKLFITQGGLQSTDEAINAGVPLIGMPLLGDQWYNVEQYVHHKIGLKLDMDSLTADNFKSAVIKVVNDDSFRTNIVRLRGLMRDEPQSALDRAVWWTEHVLRHGGARHLRAPAANMTWAQYLDVELMTVLALAGLAVVGVAGTLFYLVLSFVRINLLSKRKLKAN